jgi:drug/metabolite transporter (DMT)-like permease
MIVRIVSEVGLTIVYLNTLLHLELANITAIMQVMPLTVTFAAAMFLGETVGWRRYVAIGIGFIGVLIIVRPTSDGFSGWSALVLVAVLLLTIRDLATRWLPTEIPSLVIAWTTAVSITAMGLVLSVGQGWETPTSRPVALLVVAALCLVIGYFTGVQTVRIGDIAASAPFRYTVLIWGILLGYFVFDESPDAPTLIGAVVIVGASLYSLHRERVVKRRAATASGSTLLGNHTD